ncbi:MAG: hypothetical protein V1918_06440 [Planctomycetota bacterium]
MMSPKSRDERYAEMMGDVGKALTNETHTKLLKERDDNKPTSGRTFEQMLRGDINASPLGDMIFSLIQENLESPPSKSALD